MSTFVIIAVLLGLAAAGFIAVPLLRKSAQSGPVAGWAAVVVTLVVLGGSALLYQSFSNWSWAPKADDGSPANMVGRLARRLEKNPDDLDGWLLLGRSYTQLEQFPMAVRAYQRADRLAGSRNVDALTGLAEALIMAKESDLDGRAGRLFEQALVLDPNSTKVLFYSAIAAMERNENAVALERFQRLLVGNPPPEVRQLIEGAIAKLNGAAPQTAGATKAPAKGAVAATAAVAAVPLKITLDQKLTAQVQQGASLFVLARTPAQRGPPLAAKRLAATFPQEVTLLASDAMLAGTGFTVGQQIEIVARVSNGGGAIGRTGDPFGSAVVTVGKGGTIAVTIDKLTP
jgi:cytochrome c-type biogenesis protein CcmH